MSRILPLRFDDYDIEGEIAAICPRYIKWTKRVQAFDFSKRKRPTIERSMPSFELKHQIEQLDNVDISYPTKAPNPIKSKNILSRIRRGGQNLKVRCKTSAELWRRWIRGGIHYNDTEVQEFVKEQKEILNNDKKIETNNGKKGQIKDQTRDQIRDQTRDQTKDQTRDQTKDQTRDQTRDQTKDEVKDQIKDQIKNEVEKQMNGINNGIKNDIKTEVKAERIEINENKVEKQEESNAQEKQSEIIEKVSIKDVNKEHIRAMPEVVVK